MVQDSLRVVRPGIRDVLWQTGDQTASPRIQEPEIGSPVCRKGVGGNQRSGTAAKIWGPLPSHADSGHIQIAALATYHQVRKFFPSEEMIREYGSLQAPS